MDHEKAIKIARQLARLSIASDSFQQCLALLNHMKDMKLQMESNLYPPMMAGVVTCYARNFNASNGIGPLPASYSEFSNNDFNLAHKKIIEARNCIYAHKDKSHLAPSKSGDMPVKVQIRPKPTLDGFIFIPWGYEIPHERVDDIIKLISFQIERVTRDISYKNYIITNFNFKYDINKTYELGVDFP